MSDPFSVLMSVVIPLTLFALPGAAIVWRHHKQPLVISAALGGLWSTSFFLLGSLFAAWLRIPLALVWLVAFVGTLIALRPLMRAHFTKHTAHQRWLLMAASVLLLFCTFSMPFLLFHKGLPTGDSQKSIVWALSIIQNGGLPNYGLAPELLNRDPVDFFTPALHAYTALLIQLTPDFLVAVGLASIAMGIGVSIIAAAIARAVYPKLPRLPLIVLTMLLLLTNIRFLRYLREPGYHLQNLVGEFLLFGALLVGILLWQSWRRTKRLDRVHSVLLIAILFSLLFSHQFSTFLAAFALSPLVLLALHEAWSRRKKVSPPAMIGLLVSIVVLVGGGFMIGLHRKVAHIFTSAPHLLPLTPDFIDYPRLMGGIWLVFGLGGLLLMLRRLPLNVKRDKSAAAFTLSSVILLAMSQSPRLNIDIPPVRALFYSAVPLSIMGAAGLLTLDRLLERFARQHKFRLRLLLLLLLLGGVTASSVQAWHLSHTVRTNSTLTVGQLGLIELLAKSPSGSVLVDDFNRRSSSWLVLGGRPMFTRIASDLARQMDEARQSELRYQLYLNQLDYEKIFSLGSSDLAVKLMEKHDISFVTGITSSSLDQFEQNMALSPLHKSDDITLFAPSGMNDTCSQRFSTSQRSWLLHASTLANSIGDGEDTFLHLPASIRGALVSAPHLNGDCMVRTASAPETPLFFNVGDYVSALWNSKSSHKPDSAVEVLVDIVGDRDGLSIRDGLGDLHALSNHELLRLTPEQVPIDDDGFISLSIVNPTGTPIDVNLIALGFSRIP